MTVSYRLSTIFQKKNMYCSGAKSLTVEATVYSTAWLRLPGVKVASMLARLAISLRECKFATEKNKFSFSEALLILRYSVVLSTTKEKGTSMDHFGNEQYIRV